MAKVQKVPSTDFIADLDRWAVVAQSASIMVTDAQTGVTIGFFLSPKQFDGYCRFRDLSPRSKFAWEMPVGLADALSTPIVSRRRELDDLMSG